MLIWFVRWTIRPLRNVRKNAIKRICEFDGGRWRQCDSPCDVNGRGLILSGRSVEPFWKHASASQREANRAAVIRHADGLVDVNFANLRIVNNSWFLLIASHLGLLSGSVRVDQKTVYPYAMTGLEMPQIGAQIWPIKTPLTTLQSPSHAGGVFCYE